LAAKLRPESQKLTWRRGGHAERLEISQEGRRAEGENFLVRRAFGAQQRSTITGGSATPKLFARPYALRVKNLESHGMAAATHL